MFEICSWLPAHVKLLVAGSRIYNSYHVLGHVWQPRDWLVYARAGMYLTRASLYSTFKPLSATVAIVQWARCSGFIWHDRSCVRIKWWYYNFLSFFYLLRFLTQFSLYYLPLIQLTSISVTIRICWPYEFSISMRSRGCHTLMHYAWHRTWYVL